MEPLPVYLSKSDAIERLSAICGLGVNNTLGSDVSGIIDETHKSIPFLTNKDINRADWRRAKDVTIYSNYYSAAERNVRFPTHLNGCPDTLASLLIPRRGPEPEFTIFDVKEGALLLLTDAPLIFDSKNNMIDPLGSKYRGLIKYYNLDVSSTLNAAKFIDGIVVAIIDDVWELNYCHWIIDWLPRLAPLIGLVDNRKIHVVTSPLIAEFQKTSLIAIGVDESNILPLDKNMAIRARHLLVPSNLGNIEHPACKASTWALNFLRSRLCLPSPRQPASRTKKIYVSRNDATGRRIKNEHALLTRLNLFGYVSVSLGKMPFAEQVALFSSADNIISMHGAALTNIVFCAPGTKVIEIFARTYGTPAFAMLAERLRLDYATYQEDNVIRNTRRQLDDIEIDCDKFFELCVDWL